MSAGIVDLEVDQGEDWGVQIFWTDAYNNAQPVNSPMQMDIKNDAGQVIYSLVTTDTAPYPPVQTITYSADTGFIQLQIPKEDTVQFVPGVYSYDLFISVPDPDSDIPLKQTRLIAGSIYVSAKVTNV